LIDFSNRHFYDRSLIVPPSPIHSMDDIGVRLNYVGGGYHKGRNIDEAERMVNWAIEKMAQSPDKSMILVTVNKEQRDLVDEIFTQKALNSPFVSDYLNKWQATLSPFAIKNLESVQGDERDIVAVSTVYGRSIGENGTLGPVHQRFGPINGKFGHRRLNVLFTRAKFLTMLFTSMKSTDIVIGPDTHRGPNILKRFLEYAEAGGRIVNAAGEETNRAPGSDFEVMVAEALRLEGYEVKCQVGVAGFFIDMAIPKPGSANEYLVGIECDGKTYHSSKYHRDRDKLREMILQNMNWKIYRIWSTDWLQNPRREMEKLVTFVRKLGA
jgi:very-short-patch-repair endonuclease